MVAAAARPSCEAPAPGRQAGDQIDVVDSVNVSGPKSILSIHKPNSKAGGAAFGGDRDAVCCRVPKGITQENRQRLM